MSHRPDPFTTSLLVCGGLVVAGFVGIGLAWRGAAATLDPAAQLPFVVSGGLGGLACIAVGSVVAVLQIRRRLEADESAQRAALLDVLRAAAVDQAALPADLDAVAARLSAPGRERRARRPARVGR